MLQKTCRATVLFSREDDNPILKRVLNNNALSCYTETYKLELVKYLCQPKLVSGSSQLETSFNPPHYAKHGVMFSNPNSFILLFCTKLGVSKIVQYIFLPILNSEGSA